jgi:integrase
VFARKLDATRWLAEVEHSKLAGAYVDPKAGRITFQAYAEQWRMMQPHRDGTATSVEQQLRRHVYPSLGDRSIGAMLPSEIQALVTRIGQTLAASTVAVVYGRISAVFSAAVRDRVIAVSPCVDVKRPKPSTEVEVVLTTDQVLAIADAILPMYRALVLTMAGTGLRPGEAFGLTVDAAPHDLRREVRVERQLVRVRGRSVVLTSLLKTDSSRRTVPVGQVVIDAVTRHQAEYRPHPELGLVFTNGRGGPLQQSPFAGTWETARERAGVPGWATPHDLRRC